VTVSHTSRDLAVGFRADLDMDCVPDCCDLASLPDDLLDVRQNLSQYSYDPADMLDSVDSQADVDGQFVSSQQSSQASEKLLGFIPFGDATVLNEETSDLFDDCQFNDIPYAYSDSTIIAQQNGVLETANDTDVVVDVKSENAAVPVLVDYFGNDIVFDMKSESSDIGTPSVAAYSPDSTDVNFLFDDDLTKQLSISDDELLKLSTRDLNHRIRLMPDDEKRKLKNRRRTLKNRGYAQTCRTRRVGQRTELESTNDQLTAEVRRLTEDNSSLTAECNQLRRERVESGTEEIELLRANVGYLSNECERLRLEGARFRAERDECKSRLDLLLSILSSSGIKEVTL